MKYGHAAAGKLSALYTFNVEKNTIVSSRPINNVRFNFKSDLLNGKFTFFQLMRDEPLKNRRGSDLIASVHVENPARISHSFPLRGIRSRRPRSQIDPGSRVWH